MGSNNPYVVPTHPVYMVLKRTTNKRGVLCVYTPSLYYYFKIFIRIIFYIQSFYLLNVHGIFYIQN